MLCGFVALLARYTGSQEIVLLSDGDAPAAPAVTVLHCDLSGEPSFAAIADRIKSRRAGPASQRRRSCSAPAGAI